MISKVSLGGGGRSLPPSSSSSSHLSASAPPFTVDRSNSKPMMFSDFQYGGSNFAQSWNFATPVPAIQNDEYRGGGGGDLELEGDSRWNNVNPSVAKASTHPVFYENVPYSSTGIDTAPLVTVSECGYELLPTTGMESAGFSSHVDYTKSLSGLDYSAQWYGLGDVKRCERSANDSTFPFPFEKSTTHDSPHHLKRGCDSCICGNAFVNNYCTSCGLFSDSIGRESYNGVVHMGHSDTAQPLRKDGYLPYDSAWDTSSNIDPISLSLGPSIQAMGTSSKSEFTDPISVSLSLGSSVLSPVKYRNPNDPYEKRPQLSGYGVNGSVSVTESFPSSLTRTPNVGLGLGLCNNFSGKSIDTHNVSYALPNEVISNYNNSKEKEARVTSNPGGQESSIPVSQSKSHKVDREEFFSVFPSHKARFTSNPGGQESSIPVSQSKSHKVDREEFFSVFPSVLGGPSSGPQAKNTSNSAVRVKFNSQVPKLDLSIGGSFPCDTAQVIKSQEKNSDCLEHHSTVIDSPCWKGATALHLSPFNLVESEAIPQTNQKSEHCHMNHEPEHPIKSFFGNTNNDDQVGYGIVFAAADQGSRTNSPAVKASKGIQCCEYSSKPAEEHYLPQFSRSDKLLVNDSFSSTEPNIVTHDTIKEGGAIAVRAAEDVLSSNSSEDRESTQPKEKSAPRLDVQMLTNSMKNISELLLSYHCSDPFALKDQNLEAIEDVISNLHALLPKKTVHLTRLPASIHSQLGTSSKPGGYFDSHVNTDVRRTEVVHEASVNAQGPRDYQPTYEEKNCNDCNEKTQNWQPYAQIKNSLDTFLDASMSKNIGPAVSHAVQNASVGEHERAYYGKTTTYDDCGEKFQKLQDFFQIKDDLDMFGDDSMTKSLKKVLDENFNCGEEIQPLALIFKNLWLEAEARLCRFNYKARFDRVKIEMEGFKSNQMKGSSASSSEKDLGSKNPQDSSSPVALTNNGKNGTVQETVIQSSVDDHNDLEASVLARLKILKGRNYPEFEQSVGQGSGSAPGLNADGLGNHGSGNGRGMCELSPGFTDKSTSEWEHVVKDDAW